jgi:hypothetical protein
MGAALALLGTVSTQLPAGAQTATTKTQQAAETSWAQPTWEHLNDASGTPPPAITSMGTWVYVAPSTPAPGQLSIRGYQYLIDGIFDQLRFAYAGLATRDDGTRVARLALYDAPAQTLPTGAEVVYDWSPGRFYFIYMAHLPDGNMAAWVMDWATGVWTYVGSVPVPVAWGPLLPAGQTLVNWNNGAQPAECSGYPRTDAYFFPLLMWVGSEYKFATGFDNPLAAADCPSHRETLGNNWVHYTLGT